MRRVRVAAWPSLLAVLLGCAGPATCFFASQHPRALPPPSRSAVPAPAALEDAVAAAWLQHGGQPEVAVPVSSARQAERLARLNYLLQPGVGDVGGVQTSRPWVRELGKRDPLGINARGFHEDVFNRDYGSFHPMRKRRTASEEGSQREKRSTNVGAAERQKTSASKRRPEMDAAGFYGDTFSNGLGEFWPLKKRWTSPKTRNDAWRRWYKRKPEMDSSGFFGDTFSNGFGDFWTMKKKNGQELNKRRPEMDSAGFYGDTFSNGFGDFWTVKKKYEKRRPEMDSAGFYGDTFSNGFGDFWTVKKRATEEVPRKSEAASFDDVGDATIATTQSEGEGNVQ